MISLAVIGCGEGTGCPAPTKLDVVVLVVDTLRADHLGLYGYPRNTSPELDRFSTTSIVFRDAFAASSWTLPSVGSLLTSTYSSVHGLRAHGGDSATSMRPGLGTLAEALGRHGYRTAAVTTNNWVSLRAHGLARGFEQWVARNGVGADAVHAEARRILQADDPRPIFLYLHYMDVHGPYPPGPHDVLKMGEVPSRYRRAITKPELEAIPKYLAIPWATRLDHYVNDYDAGIRRWDASFGAFVGWLRETGRLDKTLLIVLSDHGEELLEHGGWNHGATLYQEQLAVPLLIHTPNTPASPTRDRVVGLIDVGPTILAAVGAPIPETMMGRDLLCSSQEPSERAFFSETESHPALAKSKLAPQTAIRRANAKLIVSGAGRSCFDLGADPGELSPIQDGAACDGLALELESWRSEMARAAEGLGKSIPIELSEDERQKLRGLGYLEE